MCRLSTNPDCPRFEVGAALRAAGAGRHAKEIVDKLSAELRKLADSKEVQERVRNEGGDVISSTAEEYKQDIIAEDAKWGGLVKKLNLKVD